MDPMRQISAKRQLVAAVVSDGFALFELSIVSEVFGSDYSSIVPGWYRFALCTASPSPVRSSHGLAVEVEHGLEVLRRADTVVIIPTRTSVPSPELVEGLVRAHRRGARIVSICTGAFQLAAAGLLDGRVATTHWSSAERLAQQFPSVTVDPNVLYVDEGDVLTSAGAAAGIDLCLHIVRADFGAEVANLVARDMVIPPHREGGQAQFVDRPLSAMSPGDLFGETLSWIEEHLDEPITVEGLARRAAMSPRTFARRFVEATGTTPHRFIVRRRVLFAQQLLEATNLGIDEIAARTGFGTATNLRDHFRRTVRASPMSYRRTFGRIPA